jgi:Cysteine-rich CPCC
MPVSGLPVDRHVLECKQGSFLSFLITRFNGKSASTLAILRRMELPLRKKRLNPCPCCGYLTLECTSPGSWEICPVCFWEDDPIQFADPTHGGDGANGVTLEQARRNYTQFGASEPEALRHVRPPRPDEFLDTR